MFYTDSDNAILSKYDRGRRYSATDSIDVVAGGADIAVGKINVYVVYSYAPGFAQASTGGSSNT
jgi:hypothetical protein